MRAFGVVLLLLLCSRTAFAEPNLPEVADGAAAYRKEIQSLSVDQSAVRLLRLIKQAEIANNAEDVVRLYEKLVALNTKNFRAWYQLGVNWRNIDPDSDRGIESAFNAYLTASSNPDQIDSLLLISSFLRTRLERLRGDYQSKQEGFAKADATLTYWTSEQQSGNATGLDPKNPAGTFKALKRTLDDYGQQVQALSQNISLVVGQLDHIYQEISTKVPGTNLDRMKSDDARSIDFSPVFELGTTTPHVNFENAGSEVYACINFTYELQSNNLNYSNFFEIKSLKETDAPPKVGTNAQDKKLCISGLTPHRSYSVLIRAGLPSKQGAKLLDDVSIDQVYVPDLPKQIEFSARKFVLPNSGSGEISFVTTNVDKFDLELLRITDRTLYRQIALGYIGHEIPYREFVDLRNRFSERFWAGTIQPSVDPSTRNTPVRILFPVRSLLKSRFDWLKAAKSDKSNGQAELSSVTLPVNDIDTSKLQAEGRFYAGPGPFETAAANHLTPGVYALLTRNLSAESDDDDPTCSVEQKGQCGSYFAQWFLNSDIGLSFYEGDQDFTVIARSLNSGQAKVNTTIELVSSSNRVLATGTTDGFGVTKFDRNITQGTQGNQLVAIMAQQQDDFTFLSFGPERLDLSRLNVDGRPILHGSLNAFLTTDRGIYQPGDTISLLALVRDTKGMAPDQPIKATIRLEARDRIVVQKSVNPNDWKTGGDDVEIQVPITIRPGTARITLNLGESDDAPVIGETLVDIGPIRPDRARLTFVDPVNGWHVQKNSNGFLQIDGKLNAQYLYVSADEKAGIAHGLKAEVLVKVAAADTPVAGCFDNFVFGHFDDNAIPLSARQFFEKSDLAGNINISIAGIALPTATRPTAATIETTLFDSAGPLASRSKTFPIVDGGGWIGISKIPRLGPSATKGTFDVDADLVSLPDVADPNAQQTFEFRLERERDRYAWQQKDGAWEHVRSVQREVVSGPRSFNSSELIAIPSAGQAANGSDCVGTLRAKGIATGIEVGRYVLTVTNARTGRQSSVRFYAGSTSTDADQLEPNIFTLSADKKVYHEQETINLTAEVPFDGEVLVAIADGDVKKWATSHAIGGVAKIPVIVSHDMVGKGFYALATAYRANAEGTTRAGPARAIGSIYFEVKGQETGYKVGIRILGKDGSRLPVEAVRSIPAGTPLSLEACVWDQSDCSANAPDGAYATAFVVDEGLLSLTGRQEQMPDPEAFFFGRKRFGLRVMDNYDRLLLKEGGDRPTRLALSNYTSTRIVAQASGPVRLENGKASFTFPHLDLQNGSLSIYVAIWSRDYAAAFAHNIVVRSHVVADLDVPNSVIAGDRAIFPLRLQNIDYQNDGDFAIRVAATGPISGVALFSVGEKVPAISSQAEIRVRLRPDDPPKTVYLEVDAASDKSGDATLDTSIVPLSSPVPWTGNSAHWTFDVRPAALSSMQTVSFPLSRHPQDLRSLVDGLVSGSYLPETVSIVGRFSDQTQPLLADVGNQMPANAPPILDQLVWQALQQIYGSHTTAASNSTLAKTLGEILSLQMPNGSFVPYRTIGDLANNEVTLINDNGKGGNVSPGAGPEGLLRAAEALDVLSAAKAAAVPIPPQAFRSALQFVRARLDGMDIQNNCSLDAVFALWVLLNANAPVDDAVIDSLPNCTDDIVLQAAAAATAAKYGVSDEVSAIVAQIQSPDTIQQLKSLNDFQLAVVQEFLQEAHAPDTLLNTIADSLSHASSLSPAATAWVTRTSFANGKGKQSKFDVSNLVLSGILPTQLISAKDGLVLTQPISYTQLKVSPVSVAIKDSSNARGSLTIEGVVAKANDANKLPSGAIRRRFFDLQTGSEVHFGRDPIGIGQQLVVVIEGDDRSLPQNNSDNSQPADHASGAVLISDLLPSAFQLITATFTEQMAGNTGSDLSKVKLLGDLRSIDATNDRWVALVVPNSWRDHGAPVKSNEAKAPNGSNDGGKAQAPSDPSLEFRQAYVVRVGMAGHFTLPPVSIEATAPPITTFSADRSSIDIGIVSAQR